MTVAKGPKGDLAELRALAPCPACGAQFSRVSAVSRLGAKVTRTRLRCFRQHSWDAWREREGGAWTVGLVDTQRKRGRPPGRTAPATTVLGLRLTEPQRAALDAAVPKGVTLAEWARETLLRAAGASSLGIAGRVERLTARRSDGTTVVVTVPED